MSYRKGSLKYYEAKIDAGKITAEELREYQAALDREIERAKKEKSEYDKKARRVEAMQRRQAKKDLEVIYANLGRQLVEKFGENVNVDNLYQYGDVYDDAAPDVIHQDVVAGGSESVLDEEEPDIDSSDDDEFIDEEGRAFQERLERIAYGSRALSATQTKG